MRGAGEIIFRKMGGNTKWGVAIIYSDFYGDFS